MRYVVTNCLRAAALLSFLWADAEASLKINEVYYDVSPQGGNQFVELYNAGTNTVHLDGLILTDEAGSGTEGVYQFPGGVGGTNYPVAAGGRVTIAVDAIGATSNTDWECYAGGADDDNPAVPNLSRIGGLYDLSLFSGGDNVLLATGTDTNVPIDQATVIDGVNFAGGGGELVFLSSAASETDGSVVSGSSQSLSRCDDGADTDASSAADFFARAITPKAPNNCAVPSFVVNDISVAEGNTGTTNAIFTISLTATSATPESVTYVTSNGTAVAGTDYFAVAPTTVVFAAGVTSQPAVVQVINNTVADSNRTFFLILSSPTNAVISDGVGVCTIIDDDTVVFTSSFTRIAGPAAAITATWSSVSGKAYQVEVTTALTSPAWTNFGGVVTAQSSTASATDTNAASSVRIFRVKQLN